MNTIHLKAIAVDFCARFLAMITLTTAMTLLVTSPASASFEQVATFGELRTSSPYAFGNWGGIAVNSTGAGGVPAGTVYVAGSKLEGIQQLGPHGEPVARWGVAEGFGVAVDQTTGDVYVLREKSVEGSPDVTVYSADGSQTVTSFGAQGNPFHETITESPEKIHRVESSGIAVDSSGNVYVSDLSEAQAPFESRVMVFEPASPGDFEHYAYAGHSHDVAYIKLGDPVDYYRPSALAVDAAGNVYLKAEEGATIAEFDPGETSKPKCEYRVPSSGAYGVTVNPGSGEAYYYTYHDSGHIHQLSSCNKEGRFVETNSIALTPKSASASFPAGVAMYLAFNPILVYGESRPPGAIYGVSENGLGYIFAPAESHKPVVESAVTVSVASSGAVLAGAVNPRGFATRYVFQYIDDASYQANEPGDRFAGAREAPVGGGMAGSGAGAVSVEAALSGLAADTAYRWRLVADSHCNPGDEAEICEASGATQAFRTFPSESAELPDGRAYELVSPPLKDGGEVFPLYPKQGSFGSAKPPGGSAGASPAQSSLDGEAVVYKGFPFSFTEGAPRVDHYISRRTASGWQTTVLSPALQSNEYGLVGFDAGLTQDVFLQPGSATLSPHAPEGYPNLYSQLPSDPASFTPFVGSVPPNRSPSGLNLTFAGGSADFSKLFFEANDALTGVTAAAPAARDGGEKQNNLYEFSKGNLRLVNVLPGNTETIPGAGIGSGYHREGNVGGYDYSHAISNDGSRVFWSDGAGQVYVREDGESTREIPDHSGGFLTASADGSKVLLDDGRLYDLNTEQSSDLTAGQGDFQGIAGQSEDLSHVYFVDTQALTPASESNANDEHAEAGKDNLYAWTEGTLTFVGRLTEGNTIESTKGAGAWKAAPATRLAEASPNGRWLAFQSNASLTGYDNSCENEFYDASNNKYVPGKCSEVFLYDAGTGLLVCASCNRSGVKPRGPSKVPLLEQPSPAFGQPTYVSDRGRLFFDSQDSLSPFDSNAGVEDVYEFEPGGVGSCVRGDGCVSLISSGRGAEDSNFLAADATGGNVFFTTRDQLVPIDRDRLIDLYDAREGSGIAAQNEIGERPECHGDACQPPASGTGDPALSSLSFEGVGDVLVSPAPVTPKAKPLTRAQKLARALAQCRHKPKRRRAACLRAARKRFAAEAGRARRTAHGAGVRGGR